MQIIILKKDNLRKYYFSGDSKDAFYIKDFDEYGNEEDLLSIEIVNKAWNFVSNDKCQIIENNNVVKFAPLFLNKLYVIKINNKNNSIYEFILVCSDTVKNFESYQFNGDGDYTIGSLPTSDIVLGSANVCKNHAVITKTGQNLTIRALDKDYGVYVNSIRVNSKKLVNGDITFIMGYRIIVMNSYIYIGDIGNSVRVNSLRLVKKGIPSYEATFEETVDDDNAVLYGADDYFSRTPRFVTSINEEELRIDNPPGKITPDETPILFTVGPMLTMAMSSVISASVSIINVLQNKSSMLSILPTAVIAITMLVSTLLWPTLMRKYNNKKQQKQEEERVKKYLEYLDSKKQKIENFRISQQQTLLENYPDLNNLQMVVLNKRRNLWERQIKDDDFLNVRLGIGTVPLKLKLQYQLEEFSMQDDDLKNEVSKVVDTAKDIERVPVTISLTERNKLVIIGNKDNKDSMLKSIILQVVANHSYDEVKLVLMVNDDNSDIWGDLINLPHLWSNSKDIRFYANNYDDMSKISFYLEQVFTARKFSDDGDKSVPLNLTYKDVMPYYLIIVNNIKKNKSIEIINKVLKEEKNIGFGLIILSDGIGNLPNECNDFLMASGADSAIIKNELDRNNQQTFAMDNTDNINLALVSEKLASIPIKLPLSLDNQKFYISFLEMYKVGRVEQLNVLSRWKNNNPVNSLNVPIGIHEDGEIFNLDLHEKFYGPHGLIAGMTGSGKSEFIITFILSMCLNFSPLEVSFVLIDYKGGGLTGAFENKLTNTRLPHLAGTITNLDKAEIKRSLSSIHSELNRRQELFNQAKMRLNENTLDIYKYQKLYRDGLIDEPISHLFIICDEFAELKNQQPEFMDELISTARIGRSLGVHLILATQKPSGIVDDQIWSNSKFKVCLKVQEKSDSMDVIKRPDAAGLKSAGMFYLQVGYNDYFGLGQAAYAAAKYVPKDKLTKNVDHNVSFINDIGDVVKSIDVAKRDEDVSLGEELPNILKVICAAAQETNVVARKLWLDRIDSKIYVGNLINKYNFVPTKWNITAVIGEYDDPSNQRQGLLTLDLNNSPNTLIYGLDGKEIMVTSLIYSLITTHTPDEVQFYIMDFGTEIFGMFKDAPQVGDVIYINELEKVNNLFRTIEGEIESRKKMFIDYNGDYNLYIQNSSNKVPRIIIILNSYEAFSDNYDEYVDRLTRLSREGERYGISLVITASGVNAVRSKVSQNFSKQLCLNFNDPSDYSYILGSTHGMIPSDILGRGLVKLQGEIYEYQTAYPYKWEEINAFIKDTCLKLKEVIKYKAKKIAVLPSYVRLEDVADDINSLTDVPVGIEKNSLITSRFNFKRNPISIIAGQDASMMDKFVASLTIVLQKIKDTTVHLIDMDNMIQNTSDIVNYNEDKILDKIKSASGSMEVFIFYGIDGYKNTLTTAEFNDFKNYLVGLKSKPNVRVILIDSVSKIKPFEYESFYVNNVQAMYGIWVGSGITDQFTIKSSTYNKETRSQIGNDFGYNVVSGRATLVKLLDFYSNDQDIR